MNDGVKFIFKTLLKVPVYIYIAFFILNIFAFCFTYFKMLGLSYTVQQIVVENNYIPADQRESLGKYITEIDESMSMVSNVRIVTKGTSSGLGSIKTLGVTNKEADDDYVAGIISDVNNGSAGFDESKCVDDNISGETSAFVSAGNKHQYGQEVDIGVQCTYNWIWPLDYRGRNAYSGAILNEGSSNRTEIGGYDGGNAKDFVRYSADKGANNVSNVTYGEDKNLILSKNVILIAYRVPGLKYYPDVE